MLKGREHRGGGAESREKQGGGVGGASCHDHQVALLREHLAHVPPDAIAHDGAAFIEPVDEQQRTPR
jgi:hypothetical protein